MDPMQAFVKEITNNSDFVYFNATTITAPAVESFKDLRIKIKKKVLSDGEIFDSCSFSKDQGTLLDPEEWHRVLQQQLNQPDQDFLLLDIRNDYEQ